jgi:Tannase and feruloyl esterase
MKLLLSLACCFAAQAATCESLKTLSFADTTVTSAESVAPGSFTPPGAGAVRVSAAFCRVSGVIRPTNDSEIQIEIWMPPSNWNGKLEGVGNGGFAGSIDYRALALLVGRGYAAAATDTGHRGGATDATWALHHSEKIVDFGHRAIHETAVRAKAVIAAFYGSQPRRAYFNSCSNGGRQALMEAQRYPADYDGIIAGAPASFWTHLLASGVWDMRALSDAGWIPPAKLPAIESATLAACDALDGVKDGVIDDPSRCRFDAATLLCKGRNRTPASPLRRSPRSRKSIPARKLRRAIPSFRASLPAALPAPTPGATGLPVRLRAQPWAPHLPLTFSPTWSLTIASGTTALSISIATHPSPIMRWLRY